MDISWQLALSLEGHWAWEGGALSTVLGWFGGCRMSIFLIWGDKKLEPNWISYCKPRCS